MDNVGSKLLIAFVFLLHFIGEFLILNLPTTPLWQIILVSVLDLLLVLSVIVLAVDRWIVVYIASIMTISALYHFNMFSLKQNHQDIPIHVTVGYWMVVSPILLLLGIFIFSILCHLLKSIYLLIKNKLDSSKKQ